MSIDKTIAILIENLKVKQKQTKRIKNLNESKRNCTLKTCCNSPSRPPTIDRRRRINVRNSSKSTLPFPNQRDFLLISFFYRFLPSISIFDITVEISSSLGEYPNEFIIERISPLLIDPSPSLSSKENDSSKTKTERCLFRSENSIELLPAICSSENPCAWLNSRRVLPVVV